MSKVLFVSSEAFPLIKTGGLADVAGSLPVALHKKEQDVRLLLPAYHDVLSKITNPKVIATTTYYTLTVNILETTLPGSRVKVWLVDCSPVFDRPGGPYTDSKGSPWYDNALRFAILCHAGVDLALNKMGLKWQPDIVHCNDWQTGLIPALLSLHKRRPATVFTIHNLAYQGNFDYQTFTDLQLPHELWHMHGLEFYGQFSFIKGGLAYADKINAVSVRYAEEILRPEFGYGLDGLLRSRSSHLNGIVNGIDYKYWNPGTDNYLVQKYNKNTLNKKSVNKTELQKELNLPVDASIPMIGMVSRLVEQKGLEIILQSLATMIEMPVQIVILGTGELHYEMQLSGMAEHNPERMKAFIGYNEQLAHRIEAASDLYLMPSTFEPCGLNQLYSLRYGTLPVVTNVGGLADTVTDASEINIAENRANGFVLKEITVFALLETLKYALSLYQQPSVWRQLQLCAMNQDFSWQNSAEHYLSLYKQALIQMKSEKA